MRFGTNLGYGLLTGLAALSAERVGSGARHFQPRAFAAPELGIHFARLVLLPGDNSGSGDWLVFESNFDTAESDSGKAQRRHLEALAEREYSALAAVFRYCEGFPVQAEPARLTGFCGERAVPATACYQGHTERDLGRIRLERAVRDASLSFLERAPRTGRSVHWDHTDSTFDLRAQQEAWSGKDKQLFASIAESEDHGVQNALTHLVRLRPGDRREHVLRTAHAYIGRMAKAYFNDIGQLGGIPSIHFAKWLLVDEGRRLLFLSNYDSSWESYLGDFVDQAALGLNLAWSCTDGYPKTHVLAFGGAEDEERFKAWGRAHQLPTQVFYSAYPDLSIAAINNNTWIRHGLHQRPSATELGAWFRRLT